MSLGPALLPRLHIVTDDSVLGRKGFAADAARLLEGGGGRVALHLRGPGTDGGIIHALASELAPVARGAGARLLVNDRVDVALVLRDLDGVQLGARSLPTPVVRGLLGPARWIGVSVHDRSEVRAAVREGADFLVAGALFATPSHPGREGVGPRAVQGWMEGMSPLPWIGIGGITPGRVAEVREAGAWGVAVLGGIWAHPDPWEAAQGYLAEVDGGPEDRA